MVIGEARIKEIQRPIFICKLVLAIKPNSMKKILKYLVIFISLLITVVLGYTYISFNYYSPDDPDVTVDQSKLIYFHDSYQDCRGAFVAQAEKLKERLDSVEIFAIQIASKTDNDLTIDFCYIPAKDTTVKLLVLNSGIHGIEGFTGSAVEQMIMAELLEPEMFSEMGVLIIHAMNAWGVKHERRVTENNVDLNRNFATEKTLFNNENEGFVEMYDMLHPKKKLNTNSIENRFFMLKAIIQIAQKGLPALTQAFAQGQYQFPDAIYFGGDDFEQQVQITSDVLRDKAENYSVILSVDLHTGYGDRGTLHLFPNPVDDPAIKQKMQTIFNGYEINWGNSDSFYTVTGQFVEFIGDLFPEKVCIPMVMEFGTLNTSSTIGSVKSAYISIIENQGFHYGYKSQADSLKVKELYHEMFYPPSENWRTNAIIVGKEMIQSTLVNYEKL